MKRLVPCHVVASDLFTRVLILLIVGHTVVMPDWTRDYFERGYGQRWGLTARSDQVRLEANALYKLLHLSPGSLVMDIGCGHGRYAIALAEGGPHVIGLDFATALLDRARHLASGLHTHVRWIRGDMLRLPFRSASAGAAIVMDAFGFFDGEEENDTVLREAARVLTTGGRLVMKVVNGSPLLATFRETDCEERDGTVVSMSRTLTFDPPRMTETITVSGSRGDGTYQRRQRLYQVEELRAALEVSGFDVVDVFARPDGTPFDPTLSPTIWIVGQRCAL